MRLLLKITSLSFIVIYFSMCSKNKDIHFSGRLENILDGEMIFYTRDKRTGEIALMDSCKLTNGRFSLLLSSKNYPESIKIFVKHKELSSDTLRIFSFSTNLRYKGSPLRLDHFLLEDGIKITGKVSENTFKSFRPKSNIKLVSIDRPIEVGRQTQVAYNDTVDFGNLTDIERIKQIIRQHPYSYYYLYNLERRVSEFSNANFLSVFHCFDQDVQQSKTGQQLLAYVDNRKDKRLTFSTTLADEKGHEKHVLDKTAPYNLVVLWASWCGPCRQEITDLKQFYTRLRTRQKLHLVSVSLDKDKDAWLKALKMEQMPWQQLLITALDQPYTKEIFQFDGSIPTMLLFNHQGKIIKKVVGYEEKNLKTIENIIMDDNADGVVH